MKCKGCSGPGDVKLRCVEYKKCPYSEKRLIKAMDFRQAENIYRHPKGHTREELRECLGIMNEHYIPSPLMQAVIGDAKARLDKLNGVIDAEYTIKNDPKLLNK